MKQLRQILLVSTLTTGGSFNAAAQRPATSKNRPVLVITNTQREISRSIGSDTTVRDGRPVRDNPVAGSVREGPSMFFDNYTGYHVDVYIDGSYFGTVSPYGELTIKVAIASYSTLYCRSTGGTREWNMAGNDMPSQVELR